VRFNKFGNRQWEMNNRQWTIPRADRMRWDWSLPIGHCEFPIGEREGAVQQIRQSAMGNGQSAMDNTPRGPDEMGLVIADWTLRMSDWGKGHTRSPQCLAASQAQAKPWQCGDLVMQLQRARTATNHIALLCFLWLFIQEGQQMPRIAQIRMFRPFYSHRCQLAGLFDDEVNLRTVARALVIQLVFA
jgi:hypothetical protein